MTPPLGVMIALKPVGAACRTQRPVSSARSRDDAICCVCTIVSQYDEPLVGLTSDLPTMRNRFARASVEEDLPRDADADAAERRVEHGRAGTAAALRAEERVAGERLDETAQRHVFAEGHDAHFVVHVDDGARRRRWPR